jgi:hypothetical protein
MTCTADAVIACRRPNEKTPFSISLEGSAFVNIWQGGKVYALGDRVRPNRANGFEYECTTAGQTKALGGVREPRWPTVVGQEIPDGSVVWTCREMTQASLRRVIVDVSYTAPGGVTVSGIAFDVANGKSVITGMVEGVTFDMNDSMVLAVTFNDSSREDIVVGLKGERAI